MIKHGIDPIKPDHRDYSYRKTFGAIPVNVDSIPDFNLHFGPVPNQDAPNIIFNLPAYPYGCTDYTTAGVASDEDTVLYNPGFTESITHANAKGGGDVRESLLTSVYEGLQALGEPPSQAINHKRPNVFRVGRNPDWFVGMVTALWVNKRSISVGTPYYIEWGGISINGILPETDYTQSLQYLPWHNYKFCGKKTINGVPYLIAETHQGPEYGDRGFSYYPQQVVNTILDIQGTGAFTVAKADSASIKTVGHVFTKNLYYGEIDTEVEELQSALVFLGFLIPDAVTLVYGSETRTALAAFQKQHGIQDDGTHFGPRTRAQLNAEVNPAQSMVGTFLQQITIFFTSFLPT